MNRKHPLLLALSAAMVMGTSAPAFAAEATDAATREDVISLLWQQEGAPVINYALPFTDVADTSADAVRWAAEAKIVSGYGNGKFEPNQKITREQLAAIFYRYAAYKGYDVSVEKTRIFSALQMLRISHPMPFPQFSGRMAVVCSLVRRNMFSLLPQLPRQR